MYALSKAEVRSLLEQAWAHNRRNWLMILVAYSHALRASEVVQLTRANVHDGVLQVKRLKGSDATVQPLLTNADGLFDEREALIDYTRTFNLNQKIFPISRQHFWRLMQRYAAAAGIPEHKRHPHILKHSLCSHAIETAGIENVRRYAGHKNMSSTGEYLKRTDEEAAQAVQSAISGVAGK